MKKYSTSLAIKEMKIKTTLRFHLIQAKMGDTTLTQTTTITTTIAGEDVGGKGTVLHCW
jgi:hypothetical protein